MNQNVKGARGALVFDLDGTLVDTSRDLVRSVNYMREIEGLAPLSVAEVLVSVGRGAVHLLRKTIGIEENENERLKRLLKRFESHYLSHQAELSRPYPGIKETLASLALRYHLFLLSNKPHRATVNEAVKHGLEIYFEEVWGAGALPTLKPDPAGILLAMKRSGLPRERTVMIGDMVTDIRTGINAGVKTCFVTWGFGTLGSEDPEPSAIAASTKELETTIEELI